MADYELKSRFGPWDAFKWWLLRHNSIIVKMPETKEATVDHTNAAWIDFGGAATLTIITDCPNWHYRPFLDQHVGAIGKDWMWKVIPGNPFLFRNNRLADLIVLEIRFRKDKAKWASLLYLKWSEQ